MYPIFLFTLLPCEQCPHFTLLPLYLLTFSRCSLSPISSCYLQSAILDTRDPYSLHNYGKKLCIINYAGWPWQHCQIVNTLQYLHQMQYQFDLMLQSDETEQNLSWIIQRAKNASIRVTLASFSGQLERGGQRTIQLSKYRFSFPSIF